MKRKCITINFDGAGNNNEHSKRGGEKIRENAEVF